MTYNKLLVALLSNNVYKEIKQNESDIFSLIPELKDCKGFNQNNKWHVYDVYEHILHVVKVVDTNIYLRLAALFHDIGKVLTYTQDSNGVGHFYNHWNISVEIFKRYSNNFGLSDEEIVLITNLIFYHDVNVEKMSEKEINDMINNIGISNIKLLFSLKRADLLAQSPEYHYLLENINLQEEKIIELSKKIKD